MARTSKYVQQTKALSFTTDMWKAGLYLRLSKEDGDKEEGDKSESNSISNQRFIIEDYLLENSEIHLEDIYTDDGYTGTNFNRPNFIRLIEDIRIGRINCVIVKDLSRFGRNYVEAGQYLEVFFPVMQIRFISVVDNIDSYLYPSSMNNISVPFKNVMNEEYCRDISNKIKSTFSLKRENGEFIGSFALYGYKKDPQNKNKLLIDDEAAETVKMIFKLFLQGQPIFGISTKLNELGIPNPSKHKKAKGMKYKSPRYKTSDGFWTTSTVRYILKNRMYIGDMVQGRREKISHKIAKIRNVKEENWIIKENTHEAIIDKVTFFNIQEMLKRDTRISSIKKELGLFAGFLRCPDCGRAMARKAPAKKLKLNYAYFACTTYLRMKKSACTKHCIRSDILEKAVFTVVTKYIDLAIEMDEFIARINEMPIRNIATLSLQNALAVKEKEKANIERILLDLYPDWKNDLINKEQYIALKAKHESELERINGVLCELKKTQEREKEGIDGSNEFLQNFIKLKNIDKLTREILIALIDRIFIHEGGGIEIKFKFQDAFERAADYIETNNELLNHTVDFIQQMNAFGEKVKGAL